MTLKQQVNVLQEEQKDNQLLIMDLQNQIKELQINTIDINKYTTWDWKKVLIFILSIESEEGEKVFMKYEDKLGKELEAQQIRGKDLKDLEKVDLKDLGIQIFSDRNLLYKKIQSLTKNNYGNIAMEHNKNIGNEGVNAPTAYI